MNYETVMDLLSQCHLGALLLANNGRILSANPAADTLLHGNGSLTGKLLKELAPELCHESADPPYANIAFNEYLVRIPCPHLDDLPERTRLVVFRSATADACRDILQSLLSQLNEAVVLVDAKCRMWMLNESALKLDDLVPEETYGKPMPDIYSMLDGQEMALTRVLRSKKPLLNLRQYYATCSGKTVDIASDNFPVFHGNQLLGAFNLIQDWSSINELHQKIISLQDKLIQQSIPGAPGKRKPQNVLSAKYTFNHIFSVDPVIIDIINQCKQVARTDSSVMFYGETGTGKEMFAQSVHNASKRADHPFLAINCAAIPENLLESLLFGTEKGAYTGAECRSGLFEQANGGTLLLDEINSMNINLQSKLLRVLQDGVIRRVGGADEISVDVRIMSNINIPPYQAIEENKLRRDLFYRLGVVNITIPPLRDRKDDIPVLSKYFIMQCNKKLSRGIQDIDHEVLRKFRAYNWPGNVRELQHAIEHAMNILPDSATVITPKYIPAHIQQLEYLAEKEAGYTDNEADSFDSAVRAFERRKICDALEQNNGKIVATARALQMSRQNLQYYIKRHQIDVTKFHNGGTARKA